VRGFIIPSAWPFPRLGHWQTLLRARAIENQCYAIAANRVGTDGALTFCGTSQIIDPYGTVVAGSGEIESGIAIGEIDFTRIRAVRENVPALTGLRPDVYARGVAAYADVTEPA
jgi:predicted amidohydrolase